MLQALKNKVGRWLIIVGDKLLIPSASVSPLNKIENSSIETDGPPDHWLSLVDGKTMDWSNTPTNTMPLAPSTRAHEDERVRKCESTKDRQQHERIETSKRPTRIILPEKAIEKTTIIKRVIASCSTHLRRSPWQLKTSDKLKNPNDTASDDSAVEYPVCSSITESLRSTTTHESTGILPKGPPHSNVKASVKKGNVSERSIVDSKVMPEHRNRSRYNSERRSPIIKSYCQHSKDTKNDTLNTPTVEYVPTQSSKPKVHQTEPASSLKKYRQKKSLIQNSENVSAEKSGSNIRLQNVEKSVDTGVRVRPDNRPEEKEPGNQSPRSTRNQTSPKKNSTDWPSLFNETQFSPEGWPLLPSECSSDSIPESKA